MFLIERLVGVGTFTIILFLICFLISICQSNKGVRVVLFLYTIVLAILAFFYVPYVTADLYRTYKILDYFKTFDFSAFIDGYGESSTIVANIYYWIISKTGENRLLPAITAFTCYSCIFYIVRKTATIYDISKKNVALAIFFIMSTGFYMGMISGIRTVLAICLVAFCFFRESIEKKFRLYHILIYLIAALMHNFAVVIIIIRLVIPFFTKAIKPWKRVAYVIFLVVLAIFMARNLTDFLNSVFDKAESYISGDMYSYGWGYLISAMIIVIVVYFLKVFPKFTSDEYNSLNQSKIFSIVLMVVAGIFCFEYSIFSRTITIVLPIISAPCLMVSLGKYKKSNIYNTILILSTILMVVSYARGSMCSYKFFVL